MLATAPALHAQYFKSADGLVTYHVISTDPAQVEIYTTNAQSATALVIPRTVSNDGVTYDVTRVSERAFEKAQFTSVKLGDDIVTIGTKAFYACPNLTEVQLPKNLRTIGNRAFIACRKLATIPLPASLQSIETNAFWQCISLKAVHFPKSLQSIGTYAYTRCDSLTDLTVDPESPYLTVVDNVLYSKDMRTLVLCPNGRVSKVTVPQSVHEIAPTAFYYCKVLKGIDLPDSLEAVGEGAFGYCRIITELNIKGTVKVIPYYCLNTCSKLTHLTLPSTVDSLGKSAFTYCNNIVGWKIPAGITSIPSWCFGSNSHLINLEVPGKVETIGEYAFYNCYRMTSVTLPESLQSIGEQAFDLCNAITDVTVNDTIPPTAAANAFTATTWTNATLHVPPTAVEAYKAAPTWQYFKKIVGDASGITDVVADRNASAGAIRPGVDDPNYYTLQGQRVAHPTPGIYIHQGKKVLVK